MQILKAHYPKWRDRLRRWTKRIVIQRWFDIGLRGKMSVLVTVGLVGLIAIFAFLSISTTRQMTQQLLREHVLQARIMAENMDSNFQHVAGILTLISSQINQQEPRTSLSKLGTTFLQDFHPIRGIYLLNTKKQPCAVTSRAPDIDWNQVPLSLSEMDETGRLISTRGLPSSLAMIAIPYYKTDNSELSGFIIAILNLSDPDIFMVRGALDMQHQGNLQVLDASGHVLVNTNPDRVLTNSTINKITAQFTTSDQPTFEACLGCEMNETESGTIIAYASLSQVPWAVLIWHDSQELFAPVRTIGSQTLILGSLTIIGALLLVVLTTRSVIQPVQLLTEATRKIGEVQADSNQWRSFECPLPTTLTNQTVHRRDEIGILTRSFTAMCTRLEESIDEIQSWNRELDARVQARTQQLSILNAVAMTVNQSLNLEEILDRALDEVIKLTEIDVVAIYIQNSARGHLELRAFRGLSEEAASKAYQIGLLDGDCGGVLELGRTIVVPDISSYRGRGARALQQDHITSLMHVPLMTKGWSFGSMCVGTRDSAQFHTEEQELLTAIGNQIAIAVENARLYADLQRKERVRGELFKRTFAAQEDERKRIARELHDEISQSLTALLYEAEDGLELDQLAKIKQRLHSICALSKHTLEDVHKLIFDLRPSMLDQLGLIPALRWLSETRLEHRGVRVSVISTPDLDQSSKDEHDHHLSPDIETALYRVVQEAINNIARHAAARNVEIKLNLSDSIAAVEITDDGIGFDPAEFSTASVKDLGSEPLPYSANRRGLGLLGMEERIQLMGGEFEILSTPGSGTAINIRVPIARRKPVYD